MKASDPLKYVLNRAVMAWLKRVPDVFFFVEHAVRTDRRTSPEVMICRILFPNAFFTQLDN